MITHYQFSPEATSLEEKIPVCLPNPNVQPNFSNEKYGLDYVRNVSKKIVYCCLNIP
jgi:hypothetical protein